MIQVKDLQFSYRNKKVLSGLNLDFQAGHIYGLMGRNGTGKSTLLKNIVGALFPCQGSISVLGYQPGKRQPSFLQDIFIVSEEFYLPDISVQQFVNNNAVFYPWFSKQQFDNYLQEFMVPLDINLHQLSYGQRKKVFISYALACNTSVLLMDEPTNGLDILSKSQFRKIIAGAVHETKCIVISTHQIKDLENLIDQVTVLDEGKILFNHSLSEISSKLIFKISFDEDELSTAFYKEEVLKGNIIVAKNTAQEEGKIDLEILYKAIVANPEKLGSLFQNQYQKLAL